MSRRHGKYGVRYLRAYEATELYVSESTGHRYEGIPCVYCGEESTSDDHLIPYSHMHILKDDDIRLTWMVPCCSDCNRRLSNLIFSSPQKKRSYIRKALRDKLSVYDDHEWTEQELEDLGYVLRSSVLRYVAERETLKARIRYNGRLPYSMWADL